MSDQTHEVLLSGPGKNAMSTAMMRRLEDELLEAAGKPVLLHGDGDAFSAGLDLTEVAALDGEQKAYDFLQQLERTMVAYYTYPAPVVACVNGHAIAGGCVLALCADWRVAEASARTKIGLNEVALGVEFPPHTLQIVLSRVPPIAQHRVVLGAELFSVEDAVRVGLVDEVADDAYEIATHELRRLAALPRAAYVAAKRAVRADLMPAAAQERGLRAMLGTWTSAEVRARVLAVLKR